MSTAFEILKNRRSCRKYKSDAVPQEKLDKVIEAGLYAASGMGQQSPIIIQVTDKKVRDELSAENAKIMGKDPGFDPFYGAPAVLIVLAKKAVRTYVYDGALTMGNMLNEAHEQGLGSCWIHRAKETFEGEYGKKLLASLGITEEYEGIGNCIIGYADTELPAPPERKDGRVFSVK